MKPSFAVSSYTRISLMQVVPNRIFDGLVLARKVSLATSSTIIMIPLIPLAMATVTLSVYCVLSGLYCLKKPVKLKLLFGFCARTRLCT